MNDSDFARCLVALQRRVDMLESRSQLGVHWAQERNRRRNLLSQYEELIAKYERMEREFLSKSRDSSLSQAERDRAMRDKDEIRELLRTLRADYRRELQNEPGDESG
jgi:hypothetical protein